MTPPDPHVYRLTPAEAKREALGRGFALVGSLVGVVGTAMLLSVNPAVKAAASSAYRRIPAATAKGKTASLIVLAGAGMLAAGWWYSRKLQGK